MIYEIILWILAVGISIPVVYFAGECFLAVLSRQQAISFETVHNPEKQIPVVAGRPRIAVIIPAHNEAEVLAMTLANVRGQLQGADSLLVIADNCTDQTAEIARQAGAEVLVRYNSELRGKGYALAHGVDHLSMLPAERIPQVVVVVDADCLLAPGTLNGLSKQAVERDKMGKNHPAQAIYLMQPPPGEKPNPKGMISALAFLFKNQVRPIGLAMLGGPCLLTGTGMAFAWEILNPKPVSGARICNLATGNIVEDMQMGLDLACLGYTPKLCAQGFVLGTLPTATATAKGQRKRWEHGHLQTMLVQGPKVLAKSAWTRNYGLLLLGVDLFIPPLSLLVSCWFAGLLLTLFGSIIIRNYEPFGLLLIVGLAMTAGLFMGWARFAKAVIPFGILLRIPLYILWKIPMYFGFFVNRQKSWNRTARN